MSRDWKPGDVGVWQYDAMTAPQIALRVPICPVSTHKKEPHWHLSGGGWTAYAESVRGPFVVIDPEDPKQVERLSEVIRDAEKECGQDFWEYDQTALKLALCEFADPKPPKPDEPTGLGAVVEDAEGDLWVRCDAEDHGSWRRANDDALWRDYLSIDAVRVLSEGIDA
jgi:hypothetical protein